MVFGGAKGLVSIAFSSFEPTKYGVFIVARRGMLAGLFLWERPGFWSRGGSVSVALFLFFNPQSFAQYEE